MNKNKRISLFQSFAYAVSGIIHAFRKERNIKIQGVVALITVVAAIYFKFSRFEWVILLFTIGLVIVLELVNTSIEALVDLVTEEYRRFAAIAKNVAAGAVLFSAFLAVITGLILFFPYVIQLLK